MRKTRATLNEMPVRESHDLTMLVKARVYEISIGRADEDSEELILLGQDSANARVSSISKRHATIRYNPDVDIYTLVDHSTHGTKVGDKEIHNSEIELKNEDMIRFAGYGPVVFFQEEVAGRVRRDTAEFRKIE